MIGCGGSCAQGSPLVQTSTSNVGRSIAINSETSCWRYSVQLRFRCGEPGTCDVQCAVCNMPVCVIEAEEFGRSWPDVCVLSGLKFFRYTRSKEESRK
jgi:hypothetical protein